MKLLSFTLSGSFAAFRDPSVSANQTVYFIPSKSAIVGLLGAILGVKRGHRLETLYSVEYLELFKRTNIGIQLCNDPKKITMFTNHVSLKESKTKPFKTELLELPEYIIYIYSSNEYMEKMIKSISENNFVFSPYLGHAYCPARIDNLNIYSTKKVPDPTGTNTRCVILDESDFTNNPYSLRIRPGEGINHKMIIERHLHHFFKDGIFTRRVLKHWIPVGGSKWIMEEYQKDRRYSTFVEVDEEIICIY
jgi:CRISPR-associated protein Cas5h